MLADGRQDFVSDPMLEPLCAFQLAAENQTVQAGFVDDGSLALVIRTITLNQGSGFILLINVCCQCVFRLCVPKCCGNVLSNELRVIVNEHDADFAKLGVVEDFDVLRQRKLH